MKLGNRLILVLTRLLWHGKRRFPPVAAVVFSRVIGTVFDGYPGPSLSAASINRALSGQALDRWKRT